MSRCSVRAVQVRTRDIELSGLSGTPGQSPARGLILALHGGGYSAGYWHCPAEDGRLSLLNLATELGFHILAVDRPGYGASQNFDPVRLDNQSQVSFLFDVINSWTAEIGFEGPVFVIGHSIGGILALLMAADPRSERLSAVDVLGVPLRGYPMTPVGERVNALPIVGTHVPPLTEDLHQAFMFGPTGTYSRDAIEYDRTLLRPMPVAEYRDALAVPAEWPQILPAIRIPVQVTVAEHETMLVTGPDALRRAQALLNHSPRARFHSQEASGHNASAHHIARAYHMRAIAFFEECIAAAWPAAAFKSI